MKILITGVEGFAGGHLASYLLEASPQDELHGTTFRHIEQHADDPVVKHAIDLTVESDVTDLLADLRPDAIFHLAAQAAIPVSFERPWDTLRNNILSQLNLINAGIKIGIRPRILIVSSAHIYGSVSPDQMPITEETPFKPTSPYSVSKVTQDMLGLQYYLSHGLPILRARAFNHLGPGQREDFVAPAFAMQIARIEAGHVKPVLEVGDLSEERDFTDVRDIVRAYHLIVQGGDPGDVYNVCSGQAKSIQSLLDELTSQTSQKVEIRVNPALFRPDKIPMLKGDNTRIRAATGWQPQISFEQSLADILSDARMRVQQQAYASS